jgi:hypothetical protein
MFVLKWKRQQDISNGRNSEEKCPEMTEREVKLNPWGYAKIKQEKRKCYVMYKVF